MAAAKHFTRRRSLQASRRSRSAAQLRTSQVPSGIAGETVYRLGALPVPRACAPDEDCASYASVELFVQRAKAADPRHAALLAAFDGSYSLLSADEQHVFDFHTHFIRISERIQDLGAHMRESAGVPHCPRQPRAQARVARSSKHDAGKEHKIMKRNLAVSRAIGALGVAVALCISAPKASLATEEHDGPLAQKVRAATARFLDINIAIAEGWVAATPCVSGPDTGAMGVHFVLPARIGDGIVKADEPEALIYEPMPNGAMRLVGVEFIVLAADWAQRNPKGNPPALDGNLMNLVGAPNRYGLPAFYELHVWAWEHNPRGAFADWNTRVTCEHQRIS
jgi:hypothetical protein